MKWIQLILFFQFFTSRPCCAQDNHQVFEMVKVLGGDMLLGALEPIDDEYPQRNISIKTFYVGKYEVTQKQWKEIMGYNPSFNNNCDSCPIENVSWDSVQVFIDTLNILTGKEYRLPTEQEWEYAARGGQKSKNFIFSGSDDISEVGWTDILGETMPVGRKKPNELGIYDMTGNVDEYCNSNLSDSIEDLKINGTYYKIFRGCNSAQGDMNNCCRLSYRCNTAPHLKNFHTGFRLALDK